MRAAPADLGGDGDDDQASQAQQADLRDPMSDLASPMTASASTFPAPSPPQGSGGGGGSGFDVNRRLCEDGACIGVVGAGGACTVCGRVVS